MKRNDQPRKDHQLTGILHFVQWRDQHRSGHIMPQISIGVPFYNCQSVLADTVRSIFAQSFEDWELILLDDGSTDGSLEIAQSIKDSRVQLVSDSINKGIGARRRQIVEMASAGYLAWQDADDMMHPDRLSIQYAYMQKNPHIALVDAWSYLIDTDNHIVGISRPELIDVSAAGVVAGPVLTNGASLGRMELYHNHQFDPDFRLAEDWDLWARAFKDFQFGRISQPLYFRRCVQSDGRLFDLKSAKSLPYARKIMLGYGPNLIGWRKTVSIIAEYHLRWVIRTLLSLTGLQRLRPASRANTITEEERASAEASLERILCQAVPGLEQMQQT